MSGFDPFSALGAKIFGGAALALLLVSAALGLVARAEHERAERWQLQSTTEADNHRQTKANYSAAQALAAEKAKAVRIATEQRYAALAKEADDANQDAADWRAAARRYADAGGLPVHPASAARGAPGGTGAARVDLAPEGADRSGEAAVVLTRADFDALTENSDRLIRLHAWGEQLIADGLAETAP